MKNGWTEAFIIGLGVSAICWFPMQVIAICAVIYTLNNDEYCDKLENYLESQE